MGQHHRHERISGKKSFGPESQSVRTDSSIERWGISTLFMFLFFEADQFGCRADDRCRCNRPCALISEADSPSIRSATSLEPWLASLPRSCGPYPQHNISRKRKAPSELQSRPKKQRRNPLAPLSGNVRAMSHPRMPVGPVSSAGGKGKK